MLVLPVEALPYKRRGRLGEFKGPMRRIRSRTCDFLPGRPERRWRRELESSGIFGGAEGFNGVGAGEMEAADRVVLLSGSGVFGCFPIYDRIKRRVRERERKGGN